ncbi:MAG: hypothetical protein IJ647_00765 [Prevotella sp.]|nr:hypothetical protein [Prevotella sp.]
MKELRFLQPNQIDAETLKDPIKLKAYFDWKYENFEDEYKLYCEEKRKLRNEFLNALSVEKREYYLKRYEEFYNKFSELHDRYDPIISKAIENKNIIILEKTMDEEQNEKQNLDEEYKDIDFMLE